AAWAVGDQILHHIELAVAQERITGLEEAVALRIREHGAAALERQDQDVAFAQAGLIERLPDELRTVGNRDVRDAIGGADREALANVALGQLHLVGDVVDDAAGDVEGRRALDALEARRRVDL